MRLGIDLGGTKIEAVLMDAQGDLLHRERVPTPSHSYEAILETIGQLVCKLERAFAVSANIGIGTPGSLSAETGLMRNSNTLCLNGRPLQRDLEKVLGRELRLANDANCFALSEATDGAAEGAESVFGVILGTGVGGGLVFRNQLLSGVNGIAGEWGHNRLSETDEQRLCYCGRRDCIETHLCGAGLLQTYRQFGGTLTSVPGVTGFLVARWSTTVTTWPERWRRLSISATPRSLCSVAVYRISPACISGCQSYGCTGCSVITVAPSFEPIVLEIAAA